MERAPAHTIEDLPKDGFLRRLEEIVDAPLSGSFAEFRRAVQGLGETKKELVLRLAMLGLSERALVRDRAVRRGCVRVLAALLPTTLALVDQLLNRRSHRYDYEVHFTLFCYLDEAREMPEAAPRVLALTEQYLRDIDRETASAAWMAGDLLGDDWEIDSALPVLLDLAARAKYVAGRRGALHGLREILKKPELSRDSRKRISVLLKRLSAKDRSFTIRTIAETLDDLEPTLWDLVDDGRRDDAIALCRVLLADDPDNPELHYWLGRMLEGNSSYQEAICSLTRSVELSPSDAGYRMTLGSVLRWSGDLQGGIRELEKAVELSPDYDLAHYNLGMRYLDADRPVDAERHLRIYVARVPEDPDGHHSLGQSLVDQERYVDSLEEFEVAVGLQPEFIDLRVNYGRALEWVGKPAEAFSQYNAALALDPTLPMDQLAVHWSIADLLHESGMLSEAIRHYEIALAAIPNDRDALLGLADALADAGRFEESRAVRSRVPREAYPEEWD